MSNANNAQTTSSGSTDPTQPRRAIYVCRRCPGLEVRAEDREEHRAFHIKQDRSMGQKTRGTKRGYGGQMNKPGPKSKTRAKIRHVSSTASSLFEAVPSPEGDDDEETEEEVEGYRSSRRSPRLGRGADTEDTSPAARKERAIVQHWKNSKGMNKKFLGA